VSSVAFNSDGKTMASCSGFTIRFWDCNTGKPVGQPLVHRFRVDVMAYSEDGRMLVTATALSTIHLWETATGKPINMDLQWENDQSRPAIRGLAFSPDSKMLVAAVGPTVRLWEVATGKSLLPPLIHPAEVRAVAVSPDGEMLLTGCADGSARC